MKGLFVKKPHDSWPHGVSIVFVMSKVKHLWWYICICICIMFVSKQTLVTSPSGQTAPEDHHRVEPLESGIFGVKMCRWDYI